jgi:hypothetical protein
MYRGGSGAGSRQDGRAGTGQGASGFGTGSCWADLVQQVLLSSFDVERITIAMCTTAPVETWEIAHRHWEAPSFPSKGCLALVVVEQHGRSPYCGGNI